MLKLKKLFSLGMLTAALGMFAVSCSDDDNGGGGGLGGEIETYTVTVQGGYIGNNANTTKSDYVENATVSITAFDSTAQGRIFSHWSAVDGGTITFANVNSRTTTFKMPARGVTVKANFEDVFNKVTIIGGDAYLSGDVYVDSMFRVGDTVDIEVTAADSSKFLKWEVTTGGSLTINDVNSPKTYFIMPAKDVTITAILKAVLYQVTIVDGKITGTSVTDTSFAAGSVVSITANPPESDYEFVGWTVLPTTVKIANKLLPTTTFEMPAGQVTITANYDLKTPYSVTMVKGTAKFVEDGDTINVPSGQEMMYEHDEIIIISAPPSTELDEIFDRWTVSPAGAVVFADPLSATTTFNMPAQNVTITATYKAAEYFLTLRDGKAWFVASYSADNKPQYTASGAITSTTPINSGKEVLVCNPDATDEVFDAWTGVPTDSIKYGTVDNYCVSFNMPRNNVTVAATYETGYNNFVRFSWEAAEQSKIFAISADSADVADWWETVWYYFGCDTSTESSECQDILDTPLYGGNTEFVASIYSSSVPSDKYKGVYLPTLNTSYTAICTAKDTHGDFDIVANYTITNSTTANAWFEVAFDVGSVISGDDELGWFDEVKDNPMTDPRLTKASKKSGLTKIKTQKLKNNGATMDVTYYVIRRAKK